MHKIGKQTIKFDNPPSITEVASIVGPKESQGPFAKYFDTLLEDEFWGEKSWEKAESRLQSEAVSRAMDKAKFAPSDIDFIDNQQNMPDELNAYILKSSKINKDNNLYFNIS